MFKTLKCPACKKELKADETKKVLICDGCGNRYKNPYYKDMENALIKPDDGKSNILARLFALRASYFYVNEQRKKIKQNNERINSIFSNEISRSKQRINGWDQSKLSDQDIKDRHVNDVMNQLESEKRELSNNKSGHISYRVISFLRILAVLIGIAIIVGVTIAMWQGKLPYPVWNDEMINMVENERKIDLFCVTLGWGAAFGVGTCVALQIILSIIVGINSFANSLDKNISEASIERRKKKYEDSKKCNEALVPLLAENNARNEEIDKKIDAEKEVIAKNLALIDQIKTDNVELKNYANACSNVLEEQFNDLIYISDWDNLDYIIYLFVTGRADAMKEALQLLDTQKRAEMIAQVVKDSTNYLSKNINSALRGLKSDLDSEFNNINNKFEKVHKQIASTRKHVSDWGNYLADEIDDWGDYLTSRIYYS